MKSKFSKLYKRIFVYARPYLGLLFLGMILAAVASAMDGALAWLVKPVLDDIFVAKKATMLKFLPVVIILVYLIKGSAGYFQRYLMRSVGQQIIMKLRNDLYQHINKMSLRFFQQIPSAVLMARITNDVKNLSSVSSKVIADFVRQILTLAALAVVLFLRDYKLAMVSILVVPLTSVPIAKIGRKLKRLSRKRQEKIAEINTFLQETFTGTKIVKAFCMEETENRRFRELNQRFYHLIMKAIRIDEITSPFMELIGALGLAAVIWYGGHQVMIGKTSTGAFFSFMAALFMMYGPIRKLAKMNNTVQQAMASAERVFSVLDTPLEIQDCSGAIDLTGIKTGIRFRNVFFEYDKNDGLVLQDINLDIARGNMVALVGMSGAGKSTLANLIPRFYDVTSGSILINEIDIRKYSIKSLRRNIGIVTQESILFDDTISYNIAYARPSCSQEEILKAAKAAYAHDFIVDIPNGYNSVIGERGCRLSGGQKQRISIARALLKDADILILDEATSDLDAESEHYVQKAFENLMMSRTTLVIAHRLSTIMNADKIAILDKGRIVDIDCHDNLIKKDGTYKDLFEAQFRNDVRGIRDRNS